MSKGNDASFPVLGTVLGILGTMCNFVSGFVLGLAAPLAAIVAIVAGIRFLTGQVPFLGDFSEDPEGGRRLSLQLMSTDQAKEAFDEHKELMGGDIVRMKEEIQIIIQETRAGTEASVPEEEQQEAPDEEQEASEEA